MLDRLFSLFDGDVGLVFDTAFFLRFVLQPSAPLLKGLGLTVLAAVVSQILGVALGCILALAGLSRSAVPRGLNHGYLFFFRGTPVLVQLVLIYYGLPHLLGGVDLFPPRVVLGPVWIQGALLAGIVTFGLHEAAYMSEIIRAGIQSIDDGQSEAARALGMTPALAMRRIVLPQAARVILPPLGNQFNQMLKTTSLLSVIAVPELFRIAEEVQSATYKSFEVYLGVSVYYLALTGGWAILQMGMERWLSRSRRTVATEGAAS